MWIKWGQTVGQTMDIDKTEKINQQLNYTFRTVYAQAEEK